MALPAKMAKALDAAAATRIRSLEGQLQHERNLRVREQQRNAGLTAAVRRLQAMVLQHKADQAAVKARVFDAETAA